MLSLLDPVQIADLTVFRDDEDANTFYVMPDQPIIPTDANGVPDFLFIAWVKDDVPTTLSATPVDESNNVGGYCGFRTILQIADATKQQVIAQLKTLLQQEKAAGKKPLGNAIKESDPVLASPVWTKGTVALETFKVGDTEMVRAETTNVPVSLTGSLNAALNLQLDATGTSTFWQSFMSFNEVPIPINVRYDLTYKARISATMKITADRTEITKQIWQRAQPIVAKWSPPARKFVALKPAIKVKSVAELKTVQQQHNDTTLSAFAQWQSVKDAIYSQISDKTINVTIDLGESADGTNNDKVQQMLLDLATQVLTSQVLPSVFGGDPTQQQQSVDTDDSGDSGATTSSSASSSGTVPAGANKLPTQAQMVQMPPVDTDAKSTDKFELNLTNTQEIEQSTSPSNSLKLAITDPKILNNCFVQRRVSDGPGDQVFVAASAGSVNFASDGITGIHVYLKYEEVNEMRPDKPTVTKTGDQILRANSDVLRWWFAPAFDAKGKAKTGYQFRTDVDFGETALKSDANGWIDATDEMLDILPAHLGIVRVGLVYTAPKGQVDSATVVLSHTSSSGVKYTDTLTLSSDAPTKTWIRPTGDLATATFDAPPPTYTYQVSYTINGNQLALPVQTSTQDGLELPGPFTKALQYTLAPQGSFDGVSSISGDVTYTDPSNGYRVTKPYTFTSLTSTMPFNVPAFDGGPETVTVTATITHNDGSATPLDPITAPPGTVRVGLVITSFLTIQVRCDLLDFQADVQLAVVTLSYAGSAQGDLATTLTFNAANASTPQTWRVPLKPGGALDFDYDIRFIAHDRTKSSEAHKHPFTNTATQTVLLLDRTPGAM